MRKKILFICGTINHTTQMYAVSKQLPEYEHWFAPHYCDGYLNVMSNMKLLEFTPMGQKLTERCLAWLEEHDAPIDMRGDMHDYDLVVTCSDVLVQRNIRRKKLVVVQEGIHDPESFGSWLWRRFRFLPRWFGGTALTALSCQYDRFCAASEGYKEHFVAGGAPEDRIVVTGIPNFDNADRFSNNDLDISGYVLVCTSDGRETLKGDDRLGFLHRVGEIANGRPLVFKLHPNEEFDRARDEIWAMFPDAMVFHDGSAEELIANCDALVTEWSSTVFVGLALDKEVYSNHDLDYIKKLTPLQTGRSAADIAGVCRELVEDDAYEPLGEQRRWSRRLMAALSGTRRREARA